MEKQEQEKALRELKKYLTYINKDRKRKKCLKDFEYCEQCGIYEEIKKNE